MVSPATILAACDGYGGFELAFRHLGLDVRTVCRIEREGYAAAVLVEYIDHAAAKIPWAEAHGDLRAELHHLMGGAHAEKAAALD